MQEVPEIILQRSPIDDLDENPDLILAFRHATKQLRLINSVDGSLITSFQLKGVTEAQGSLTAKAGGGAIGATLLLPYGSNTFTTVATNGDSAILPPDEMVSVGDIVYGKNADSAQSLSIFPRQGGNLGSGTNTPYSVPAGYEFAFKKTASAGGWFLYFTENITAFAGGGQTDATQLVSEINHIGTCASNGSVKMPIDADFPVGSRCVIINRGGGSLVVFPQSGGTVGGGASQGIITGQVRQYFKTAQPLAWQG